MILNYYFYHYQYSFKGSSLTEQSEEGEGELPNPAYVVDYEVSAMFHHVLLTPSFRCDR